MNRLIDGAVQLLDEAAKRKTGSKTHENYGDSTLSLFDFNKHDHPHYKEWERIVQKHPDFHGFEDYRRDTRSNDRGFSSGGLVTRRHAIDEFGNILGVYEMPHPTGSINSPVKPKKRKK